MRSWFPWLGGTRSDPVEAGSAPPPVSLGRRAAATFAAKVTFENVERRFGERAALAGFNLVIEPGEVVCLLGPSGCGKTTLLRIASGIERPTSGRVLINDRVVAGPDRFVPPEERSVGLMFQDFALFPHLTILQNVAFGLKGLPREEAAREAMSVLARVGLASYADAYPHVLSGGQQQRVALARAIVPRPAVMLMDEPFSGLDVQLRDSMQEETLALLRETRATSIIVTHHPEEAMRLGDRIVVMRQGRAVQVGSSEHLYHHPAELFIARLFSEINEVEVVARGGFVETPVGALRAKGIRDGETAIVCIRERSIRIEPAGSTAPRLGVSLPGRIMHVKFLGDVALVEIGVQGFERSLRARVAVGSGWSKGQEVAVSICPEHVLVFPQKSAEKP